MVNHSEEANWSIVCGGGRVRVRVERECHMEVMVEGMENCISVHHVAGT